MDDCSFIIMSNDSCSASDGVFIATTDDASQRHQWDYTAVEIASMSETVVRS